METSNNPSAGTAFNRRRFLATSALLGTGLVLAPRTLHAQNASVPSNRNLGNAINIALVGAGAQGQVLLTSLGGVANSGAIPFRLKAICDIWPHQGKAAVLRERANGWENTRTDAEGKTVEAPRPLNAYYGDLSLEHYYQDIGDLLEKEKDLDAIFVATPDHWHARHTIAGLEAGKHVYCEKMMARTADEGRAMVLAAGKAKKLLQIGHQRRSNPNYRYVQNILLQKYKFLGRITNASGQWNRGVRQSQDIELSKGLLRTITKDILKRSEMDNPHEFRNWRWFKKYSNGPISDLGAHQIDIFNWVFGRPRSVIAAGGNDYYSTARDAKGNPYKPREWYDNVMCIFDYDHIPDRPVGEVARAYYQVLTTTSNGGGYFETFMGDRGSLKISETAANIKAYSETDGKPYFDFLVSQDALSPSRVAAAPPPSDGIADARASAAPEGFDLTSRLGSKYIHQFHIENFFRAIRGEAKLNCDGAHAFQSEAPIFRINEAVEAEKRLFFTDDDFALVPSQKDKPADAAPAPAASAPAA